MQGCTLRQDSLCQAAACLPYAYQRGANVSFVSGIVQKPDTTIAQSPSNTSITLGAQTLPCRSSTWLLLLLQ